MSRIVAAACALLILGLAFPLAPSPAAAQGIMEKAKEAEALLARGRTIEAIDALDEAAATLWVKAPLAFRRGIWVAQAATGYGIFQERPSAVFAAGEPMLVYVEPVGFGWRKDGNIYSTDMSADVAFRDKSGKVLFGKEGFLNVNIAGRYRNRELFANLNYTVTGFTPGEYEVETTFTDKVTGKKGSFVLPFTVK